MASAAQARATVQDSAVTGCSRSPATAAARASSELRSPSIRVRSSTADRSPSRRPCATAAPAGRHALAQVGARGLAGFDLDAGDVDDVVGELEGHADLLAVLDQQRLVGFVRAGEDRAELAGRGHQRTGLVRYHGQVVLNRVLVRARADGLVQLARGRAVRKCGPGCRALREPEFGDQDRGPGEDRGPRSGRPRSYPRPRARWGRRGGTGRSPSRHRGRAWPGGSVRRRRRPAPPPAARRPPGGHRAGSAAAGSACRRPRPDGARLRPPAGPNSRWPRAASSRRAPGWW